MSENSGFIEAPPTKNPSISFLSMNGAQFSAVTDPPYMILVACAISAESV
jgi:hypothetical protein